MSAILWSTATPKRVSKVARHLATSVVARAIVILFFGLAVTCLNCCVKYDDDCGDDEEFGIHEFGDDHGRRMVLVGDERCVWFGEKRDGEKEEVERFRHGGIVGFEGINQWT